MTYTSENSRLTIATEVGWWIIVSHDNYYIIIIINIVIVINIIIIIIIIIIINVIIIIVAIVIIIIIIIIIIKTIFLTRHLLQGHKLLIYRGNASNNVLKAYEYDRCFSKKVPKSGNNRNFRKFNGENSFFSFAYHQIIMGFSQLPIYTNWTLLKYSRHAQ